MAPRQNDESRRFDLAMRVGLSLANYEMGLAKLRRHYLTVLQEWHRAFELEHVDAGGEPDWPTQLRELAEKLMRVPVDVMGTDQAHVDLLLEIATFLDQPKADDEPEALEVEAAGVQVAETYSIVAKTLAGAEERRSRTIRVEATTEDERRSE